MPKFRSVLSSFSAGEVGPRAAGRIETKDYFEAAELMENFLALPGGGMRLRPGTQNAAQVAAADDGSSERWIVPFIVNKDESYLIYFDPFHATVNQRLRVFRFQSGALTELTVGAEVLNSLTGTAQIDGYRNYVQSADTLFLTDITGDKPPIVISRIFDGSVFSCELFERQVVKVGGTYTQLYSSFCSAYPYLSPNVNAEVTLRPSAVTGALIDLFAEDSAGNPINFFSSEHISTFFKITHGAQTGICRIVGEYPGDATKMIAEVQTLVGTGLIQSLNVDFGATTRSDNWEESDWSNYRGYPKTVTLFEGRLIFGGNKSAPDTVWFSRSANIYFMMQNKLAQDSATNASGLTFFGDNAASDPFDRTLASSTIDTIKWLIGEKFLAIGTEGGEYTCSGNGQALSNLNITIRKQTSNGGDIVEVSDDGIYFVNNDGDGIVEFKYSEESGGYKSNRLDFRNREIIKYTGYDKDDLDQDHYNSVKAEQIFWNKSRQVLWLRTSRERMVGLVIDQASGTFAFQRNKFGGDPRIISACNIKDSDGYEYTFMLTGRGTGLNLEFIGKDFLLDNISDKSSADHLVNLDGSFTETVVGSVITVLQYANLEMRLVNMNTGEDYGLIAANALGEFTLPSAPGTDKVLVGYDFQGKYISLPVEGGGAMGPSAPSVGKIDTLVLNLYKTRNLVFGFVRDADQDDFTIPDLDDLNDGELFTGYTEQLKLDSAPDESQQFYLKTVSPSVCTILNMGIKGQAYE